MGWWFKRKPAAVASAPVVRPRPSPEALAAAQRRRAVVEQKAAELLRRFWDGKSLPLLPERMAAGLGVPLIARGGPSEPDYAPLGRFVERPDGGVAIEVNVGQDLEAQRFIVAHILGHHVLQHRGVPPETLDTVRADQRDRQEDEASYFALELLMPERVFMRAMQVGYDSTKKLSRLFEVPAVAANVRGIEMDRRFL